jgi:hypothetical protein
MKWLGILNNQASGSHSMNEAETTPEDEGVGDDSLLKLLRGALVGHEGATEIPDPTAKG